MDTLARVMRWTVVAALFANAPAFAVDKRFDVDFNAAFGARYDSNVALVDLDSNAGEADTVTALEAGLSIRTALASNLWLKAGYDFSGTRYRTFSEFDLDLHHVHTSLQLREGAVDSAVAYDRFEGLLAGEDYLVQTQISPSISRLIGSRWYLRGAYAHVQKSYATFADRDARSDALRLDTYLLIDSMNHYIALGMQASSEDARSDAFDFDSRLAQLGWGYRVDLTGNDIVLKAQVRYERREYGLARIDNRLRTRLAAMIPFSEYVSVGASIEHTNNTSAKADADLDRTVFGMEFGVSF